MRNAACAIDSGFVGGASLVKFQLRMSTHAFQNAGYGRFVGDLSLGCGSRVD